MPGSSLPSVHVPVWLLAHHHIVVRGHTLGTTHDETIFDSCETGLNNESTVVLMIGEFAYESELRIDRP